MFTDGDFHNPTLSRVIVFATEYESLTDEAKRRILYEAKSTGDVQVSHRIVENLYGPGFAVEYTPEVHGANAGQNGRGKRTNGKGSNQGYRAKSLKERLAEEGLSHLLEDDEAYSSQETDAEGYNTDGFKEYDIVSAVYTIRNEKATRGHDLVEIGSMPTLYRKLFGLSGEVYTQ